MDGFKEKKKKRKNANISNEGIYGEERGKHFLNRRKKSTNTRLISLQVASVEVGCEWFWSYLSISIFNQCPSLPLALNYGLSLSQKQQKILASFIFSFFFAKTKTNYLFIVTLDHSKQ